MSKVLSPVSFFGYAVPGYDHKGLIELFGEDGTLLNSEILQLNTAYKWAFFSWSLPFTVRGAGELGRLSLSTRDQYGRLTAIRSVPLMLLADGFEILTPAEAMMERVVLEYPPTGKRVSGGTVKVEGQMMSYNDQPLTLELISIEGLVVGFQVVPIPPGKAGDYFEFRVDIPYYVPRPTPVLLTIKQADSVIPGLMYLYSQEIILSP